MIVWIINTVEAVVTILQTCVKLLKLIERLMSAIISTDIDEIVTE